MVAKAIKPKVKAKVATASNATAQPRERHRAGIWTCSRCHNSVHILVDMTAPPACSNHKGFAFVIMERKKGKAQ